jgi:hypothetical protein
VTGAGRIFWRPFTSYTKFDWSISLPRNADQRMVWLRLGSGRDMGRSIVWDSWFVAVSLRKPPIMRVGFPWICLDLLGFSRPKPDFSMGYAGFLAEENFSRSFAAGAAAPGQEPVFLRCRTQYGSSSKSNPYSAFLQSIAVHRNCRFVDSIRPEFSHCLLEICT